MDSYRSSHTYAYGCGSCEQNKPSSLIFEVFWYPKKFQDWPSRPCLMFGSDLRTGLQAKHSTRQHINIQQQDQLSVGRWSYDADTNIDADADVQG